MEVNRLRQLRDRVGAASGFGAQLIDVIYGEYDSSAQGLHLSFSKTKLLGRLSCISLCGRCSLGTRWLEPLRLSKPTRRLPAKLYKMC